MIETETHTRRSRSRSRGHRANSIQIRTEVTAQMRAVQKEYGVSASLFWAQLDTLCQTASIMPEDQWERHLYTLWQQWIGGSVPEALTNYYKEWMRAFYEKEELRNKNHLYTQLGSLIAKINCSDPEFAGINVYQMRDRCIYALLSLTNYESSSQSKKDQCRQDLLEIFTRYAGSDDRFTEEVRDYFTANHERYRTALDALLNKHFGNGVRLLQAPNDLIAITVHQEEKPAPTEPIVREPAAEIVPWSPVSTEQQPKTVPEEQVTNRMLLDRLNLLSEQIAASRAVISNGAGDFNAAGLCTFIEKTTSPIYQRSLSRLYALALMAPDEISTRELQAILRNFFSALSALGIVPIDEACMAEAFPAEYAHEQEKRRAEADMDFVLSFHGWSYQNDMIAIPTFSKIKKEGEV